MRMSLCDKGTDRTTGVVPLTTDFVYAYIRAGMIDPRLSVAYKEVKADNVSRHASMRARRALVDDQDVLGRPRRKDCHGCHP